MGSLSLRPGDSLTAPRAALSVGFIRFVSSANATQATGLLTLTPVGLSPTEHASLCWTRSFANNRSGQRLLCRSTFITVMEAAELWNCDNLSNLQRLSRKRTLLVQAQMGSRFMVVAEVRR